MPIASPETSIELLVPVPVAAGQRGVLGRRQAVRAGALLARRPAGPAAKPDSGIAGRLARETRLPQGANTVVSEDGTLLFAQCDGEVLLRNLLIEIVPMHVHEGDITAEHGPLRSQTAVFVTGSVGQYAQIDAIGEVYIQGHVSEAHIRSRDSGITVMDYVSGATGKPTVLRATGNLICGPARHAQLIAGGDIRLLAGAWQSTLKAGGNVYLPECVEHSLMDVGLHIEGGLFPVLEPELPAALLPQDRQHVRVATHLRALVALHGIPPLTFRSSTILDLSAGGALCYLPVSTQEPSLGTILQVKFVLPSTGDYILAIARVARVAATGVIGLAFLQMTQRHQHLLSTYCLQILLSRSHGDMARPEKRRV